MSAFHIISEDFKLRHSVRARALFKQQAFEILRSIGFLRVAHNLDLAEEITGCPAPMHRAHRLVGGCIGVSVDRLGDEFLHLVLTADGHPAKFEMRAFFKRDFEFVALVLAASQSDKGFKASASSDVDTRALNRAFGRSARGKSGHSPLCFARRHVDLGPMIERRRIARRKEIRIGIAPCFILVGGAREGCCVRHQPSPRHSLALRGARPIPGRRSERSGHRRAH